MHSGQGRSTDCAGPRSLLGNPSFFSRVASYGAQVKMAYALHAVGVDAVEEYQIP